MTFRLGHANIEQPDSAHDESSTIHEVMQYADVVTLNECNEESTRELLRNLKGWDAYIPPRGGAAEDCIIWRTDVFKGLSTAHHVVMKGGWVFGRRRGPSRGLAIAVLEEVATGKRVIMATHHAIAKWQTSAKWRRHLALGGFREVARVLGWTMVKYPHTPMILNGDLNVIGKVASDFTGLHLHDLSTPPTYGGKRYDRILYRGRLTFSHVRSLATKSDHRALLAHVTLGEK